VRHVHREPPCPELLHHPPSELRQSSASAEREGGATQLVGPQVGQAHESHATAGKLGDALHPALQRMPALDPQHAGQPPLAPGLIQQGRRGGHDRRSGGAGLGEAIDLPQGARPGAAHRGPGPAPQTPEDLEAADHREAAGDHGEGLQPHPGLLQARKVQVPRGVALAEISVPEQRVGVGVGDVAGPMELPSGGLRPDAHDSCPLASRLAPVAWGIATHSRPRVQLRGGCIPPARPGERPGRALDFPPWLPP
jgi:hypothetical protein